MNIWGIRDVILVVVIVALLIVSAVIYYKKNKKQYQYDSADAVDTDNEENIVIVGNVESIEENQASVQTPIFSETPVKANVSNTPKYGVHTATIQRLKEQAENGDVEAMYDLSLMFRYRCVDKEQYLIWLEKAADAGHLKAMVYMGQGYSKSNNEEGTNPFLKFGYSKEKYYYWIKKAADTDKARGIRELADYYREEENFETAYQYYEKALQKSAEENDENTALYVAAILADRHDILWHLESAEEDFLKAERYYLITLFYKGDIKDPDSTYPMKYLVALSRLGILYYRRYQKEGESSQYGRLAAYCLFMASICDLDGTQKVLISEPLSQLTGFISVDDMIEWEVHARHCAYLPDTINNK